MRRGPVKRGKPSTAAPYHPYIQPEFTGKPPVCATCGKPATDPVHNPAPAKPKPGRPDPKQEAPVTEHFNGLTPAEAERLALLSEELGEAVLAIGKILRHGYESCDPRRPYGERQTNRRDLEDELGDVQAAVLMMTEAGDISASEISFAISRKIKSARPFLHHQDQSDG